MQNINLMKPVIDAEQINEIVLKLNNRKLPKIPNTENEVQNSSRKYNEIVNFNSQMEKKMGHMETDIHKLTSLIKQKNQFDKRQAILYGGKNIFPNRDKLDRLGPPIISKEVKFE